MSVEQRKHQRKSRQEKIFIELLSASDDTEDDNVLIECTTSDISFNGLKIASSCPFIVDSILELLINFESGGYKFLLTAEVKWLEKINDDKFVAGFELINAEHSDYLVWQNMFAQD
jgi:hypothetical protein